MESSPIYRWPTVLCTFLFASALLAVPAPCIAQQLIDTIPAGPQPLAVAVNPVTAEIYVSNDNGSNSSVTIIDGVTNSTIVTLPVESLPGHLEVNQATNKIYVPDGAGVVTVIDGATNSIAAEVQVGNTPEFLAINPLTNKIYVSNDLSDNVTIIDGATNTVVDTVTVGTSPWDIVANPVTNQIYVANLYSGTVTAIDGSDPSNVTTIQVGTHPIFLAVNPATNLIYVSNGYSNNVSVIDGGTNSVVATIPVGSEPTGIAVNPVTNEIYVCNGVSDSLSVIDGATNTVIGTLPTGSGPSYVVVDPVTDKIYVTNLAGNSVTAIDGASNTVIGTVSVGNEPEALALNPVTNKVYVPNFEDGTLSVIAGANATAQQLVTVTPCRLLDTRSQNGGGPLEGGTSQAFVLPQLAQANGCASLASATAYSLNVTLVPVNGGPVGYLTIWPTGQDQPRVSTMNSDGRIKANAAIVSAGYQGAVTVYVSNTTNLLLDINGYFQPSPSSPLLFITLPPCRVADTRNPNGPLGGPYLRGGNERDFPVLTSNCNIPSNAGAYALNFTAIPRNGSPLQYLTVWPQGQDRPVVSTLNAPTGTIVANAAIVPVGVQGGIATYPSNDIDLVIDINGYFVPPPSGGLSLYPSAPCRMLDTRQTGGLFSGTLGSNVVDSVCGPPETALAYVFNATVVPAGPLGYLTLWPNGEQQPLASTLNAIDGAVTSNMAIVPTTDGSIDVFAPNLTQLVLDISSYFAP